MNELTPLMAQYQRIKKEHKDTILFFRLGDFYEMFGDDAKNGSKILDIALTSRQKVPMCGIPFHSSEKYISRLIKAGYKVAICEQMTEPGASKDIVERAVIRIITPGTVIEENILDAKKNNFLAAIFKESGKKSTVFGMAYADMSTGDFMAAEFNTGNALADLEAALSSLSIAEVLLPGSSESDKELVNLINRHHIPLNFYDDWLFVYDNAVTIIKENFNIKTLRGLGFEEVNSAAVSAAGSIINYLKDTQKKVLAHLLPPKLLKSSDHMILDEPTVKNLELVANLNDGSKQGSLLNVLDCTVTAPGARRLAHIILHPLRSAAEIKNRQDKITYFFKDSIKRIKLRELLKNIVDMERLLGRLNCGTSNARDLKSLSCSLNHVKEIKSYFNGPGCISELINCIGEFNNIVELIESAIVQEPPLTIKEGGIIRPEYDRELLKLHRLATGGKEWITELQEKERKRTGINSLKIGFTSVFGYYIEITKANFNQVPSDYTRKQTLVNCERFITPELKEQETLILGAEEKKNQLEYEIFQNVRSEIMKETRPIQETAKAVSELDLVAALAETAALNNYVKPEINDSSSIYIKEGRHPVVEKTPAEIKFVSNDTRLDSNENQILIITGPNMAGKSTYIRQTAIILLMAQLGSYVPAEKAVIGIADRIFTRIGTTDNIARGESTFMVEMTEVANILNNATFRSLLILDEVGRGTSTLDGISIAWATLEYLSGNSKFSEKGPRTLFATHYFELTDLASTVGRIKNFNFPVREWNDQIVFLRKLVPGSADKSYGIHVAKLAGLPAGVIDRAEEVLDNLQKNSYREDGKPKLAVHEAVSGQMSLFSQADPVMDELSKLDPERMSPIEALNKLNELKTLLKNRKGAQ